MKDEQILAYFDGRGTAEITLRGLDVRSSGRIAAIAFEFGYELHERDVVTRGHWREIYLRNDSPEVRRRTQGTLDRLRAGGPLLPQTWPPAGNPQDPDRPITPMEADLAQRNLTAHEAHGSRGLVIFAALLAVGCLALAWVSRGVLAAVAVLLVTAALLAGVAALIPRWRRRSYELNREKVARFSQQSSRQWGPPPPPPPPPPPADGSWKDGEGGQGS